MWYIYYERVIFLFWWFTPLDGRFRKTHSLFRAKSRGDEGWINKWHDSAIKVETIPFPIFLIFFVHDIQYPFHTRSNVRWTVNKIAESKTHRRRTHEKDFFRVQGWTEHWWHALSFSRIYLASDQDRRVHLVSFSHCFLLLEIFDIEVSFT